MEKLAEAIQKKKWVASNKNKGENTDTF